MQFAGYTLRNNLIVAPMAGVTDRPFRQLCKQIGAGHGGLGNGDFQLVVVRFERQDPAACQSRR
jgi:hypothetical protein